MSSIGAARPMIAQQQMVAAGVEARTGTLSAARARSPPWPVGDQFVLAAIQKQRRRVESRAPLPARRPSDRPARSPRRTASRGWSADRGQPLDRLAVVAGGHLGDLPGHASVQASDWPTSHSARAQKTFISARPQRPAPPAHSRRPAADRRSVARHISTAPPMLSPIRISGVCG